MSREIGVFIVTGLIEKAGGTLLCSATYVDPSSSVLRKRRKVMPVSQDRTEAVTNSTRLIIL